jgi:hypothetical protein
MMIGLMMCGKFFVLCLETSDLEIQNFLLPQRLQDTKAHKGVPFYDFAQQLQNSQIPFNFPVKPTDFFIKFAFLF